MWWYQSCIYSQVQNLARPRDAMALCCFFCVISFIVIQSFSENLPIMFLLCQFKLFQGYFSSEVNQRSLVTLSLSILPKSTHPTTAPPPTSPSLSVFSQWLSLGGIWLPTDNCSLCANHSKKIHTVPFRLWLAI